jgi:hypothetical protein
VKTTFRVQKCDHPQVTTIVFVGNVRAAQNLARPAIGLTFIENRMSASMKRFGVCFKTSVSLTFACLLFSPNSAGRLGDEFAENLKLLRDEGEPVLTGGCPKESAINHSDDLNTPVGTICKSPWF